MSFGIETAVKGEPRAENFFWRVDDEPALLRDTTRVDVEIADLAPIGLSGIERTIDLADIYSVRNEADAHAMRTLERISRLHREICVRTGVREVEFDLVEFVGHATDAIARKSARCTTFVLAPRRRNSAAI